MDSIVKDFLSVCPSVKRLHCDKMKETCGHILIPHERSFILVFCQEEWLVEGDSFYLKFWAKLALLERKHRFSIHKIRTAIALTLGKTSSIITNRKSTAPFCMSLR